MKLKDIFTANELRTELTSLLHMREKALTSLNSANIMIPEVLAKLKELGIEPSTEELSEYSEWIKPKK